eukprot:Gregarina_sp_Poly_1__10099@NODE_685_length_6767_cov_47_617910_g516_i0_p1_GENE_NODE_685_length_6767_cov_47_617910_g516_i0NODE_685_length_6767_cov_47_617910_g516_i0_p1_ORF_typecomplete_len1084_score151_47MMS1_N/PF10433_9/8_2e21MMS1_N/PF10433_9/2_9e03eIF2A/PF08662_11/1_2e04eIF2A/PF08662_11/0_0017CPSF_A/PF03178_15/25CPSF_A/PF03178_15/0_25_NODE_685_length_6767_cov_47_617910_g516_i021255376
MKDRQTTLLEPVGFYVHEKQSSKSIISAVSINQATKRDVPSSRLVFASSQVLNITTLTHSHTLNTDGSVAKVCRVDFERARSQRLPDVIVKLWKFRPPMETRGAQRRRWDLQPTVEDQYQFLQTRRTPVQLVNHSTYDWSCITEGFLLLTERLELVLFGMHSETGSIKSLSKLNLYRPHRHQAAQFPLLSIDPLYRMMVLHLYDGELEYIPLDPDNPFKLRRSHTIRVTEPRLVDIKFVGEGCLTDRRKRGLLRASFKSARRRINETGLNGRSLNKEETVVDDYTSFNFLTPPRLCLLYTRDPYWRNEMSDTSLGRLWLRFVQIDDLSILETGQYKCLSPLQLQAEGSGIVLESKLEPELFFVVGESVLQAIKVSWDPPVHYKSVATAIEPPLASISAFTCISDDVWVVGDTNGTLLRVRYEAAQATESDSLDIPIKLIVERIGSFSPASDILKIDTNNGDDYIWITSKLGPSQTIALDSTGEARVVDELAHLSPAIDFVWNPCCVAGGWRDTGGIKLIQHGVQYSNLMNIINCSFTKIFPLSLEWDQFFLLAILSQDLGPSAMLFAKQNAFSPEGRYSVDLHLGTSHSFDSPWDLQSPSILIHNFTDVFFVQVTTLAMTTLTNQRVIQRSEFRSLVACVDHTTRCRSILVHTCEGENSELPSRKGRLQRVIFGEDGAIDFAHCCESEDPIMMLATTDNYVGVVYSDVTKVNILSPTLDTTLYVFDISSTSLIHGVSSTYKGLEIIIDFTLIDWPLLDSSTLDTKSTIITLTTSVGDLITVEIPNSLDNAMEGISERRPLGTSTLGSICKLSRQNVMVLGERSLYLSRDASGIVMAVTANVPPNIECLATLEWPSVITHFQQRPTEKFCLFISGQENRTLSFGLLDANWQDCKIQQTFTGYTIEHLCYSESKELFVAAGLKGDQSVYDLKNGDPTSMPPPELMNRGMLVCLQRSLSGRSPLDVIASYKLGEDEIPTALDCVILKGEEYIALGTTIERHSRIEGNLRLLSFTTVSIPGPSSVVAHAHPHTLNHTHIDVLSVCFAGKVYAVQYYTDTECRYGFDRFNSVHLFLQRLVDCGQWLHN